MQEPETGQPGSPQEGVGLVPALATLVRRLDAMGGLEEMAEAVAGFAVTVLGADLAAVSLRPGRGATPRLATSHEEVARLHGTEDLLKDGPGTTPPGLAPVSIPDTRSDDRWPEWSATAARERVLAVLLLPIARLGRHALVLELYSRSAGAFEERATTGLEAAAEIVGISLRQVERRLNLEKALGTRDMIGQAQGMVMERYDLGSEQAMELLRRISQDSQAKIQQIARRLVQGDDLPSPE